MFKSETLIFYNLIIIISWGFFQSIPVVCGLHLASKATKKGKQMSLIIGKVLITTDDKEVISQVRKSINTNDY